MTSFQIAIDGPAASGKSTVAKMAAERLDGYYINTGDMYRTVAWQTVVNGLDPETDEDKIANMLSKLDLRYRAIGKGTVQLYLNDEPVPQPAIRAPEVAAGASAVAKLPVVRNWLRDRQRETAELGIVAMEGRDIGTVIFPTAQFKFFITASPEERARRRFAQGEVPEGATLESVAESIRKRDEQDSTRKVAPLKPAEGAITVNTDDMSADQVADYLVSTIQKELAE